MGQYDLATYLQDTLGTNLARVEAGGVRGVHLLEEQGQLLGRVSERLEVMFDSLHRQLSLRGDTPAALAGQSSSATSVISPLYACA